MSQVPGLISRDVIFGNNLFSENINLFNHMDHERNRQTDSWNYYGSTALCTIVHRAVKKIKPQVNLD